MRYVVNTAQLMVEGVLTPDQAEIIRIRSRADMMALAVNSLLYGGIIAAAAGFVFLLADALSVALTGGLFVALGVAILLMGGATVRMFGTASALIGAGMLSGGAMVELLDKLGGTQGGLVLAGLGAGMAGLAFIASNKAPTLRFVAGAVLLMGVGMHLFGLGAALNDLQSDGALKAVFCLYATAVLAGTGVLIDIRLVTALAIVPFAQVLDTGTAYWNAVYAFYSPEPTLSILQMGLLMLACAIAVARWPDRIGRHAGMLSIMAFVVANLCFLVGSLWGDLIGESWMRADMYKMEWEEYQAALDAFRARSFEISEGAYAIIWAIALGAMAAWAAHRGKRGLFNAAMTFAAIHAYTQAFESFGADPLVFVIGGLAAVPLAWGMWHLDTRVRAA